MYAYFSMIECICVWAGGLIYITINILSLSFEFENSVDPYQRAHVYVGDTLAIPLFLYDTFKNDEHGQRDPIGAF